MASEAEENRARWTAPEIRVAIGRALLQARGPQTAKDLAALIEKDQSNVKKEADRMAVLDLITGVSPSARATGGRPPTIAYGLTAVQRARAERELPAPRLPVGGTTGLFRRGQEVVTAAAGPEHLGDLLDVLAGTQSVRRAAWAAVCGEQVLVVFEGSDPAGPALDLLAILNAARVPARRATVARVGPARELVHRARETAGEARRARTQRDTRHASR
jgi:hypothetical protein